MIQLILFLAIGALLFSSLFFLMRRNPRAEGGGPAIVKARLALNSLQTGLLPPELIARIFARDDLDYVLSQTPQSVHKLFAGERKKIALSWVAHVRSEILSLRRFHLGAARSYARLKFRTEMKLALDFAALLLACDMLRVILYLRGPFAAQRIVGATVTAAARVCEISAKSLDFLNSAQLSTLGDNAAGRAAL